MIHILIMKEIEIGDPTEIAFINFANKQNIDYKFKR